MKRSIIDKYLTDYGKFWLLILITLVTFLGTAVLTTVWWYA